MQKIALFYNPASGRRSRRRLHVVEEAAAVFRHAGKDVSIEATQGPGTAAQQVQAALRAGYDTAVIAGGDGTINDALQGIAGSKATLGIIPMGTGNVLAHDLGLSHRPEAAARQLLTFQTRRIALGKIICTATDGTRPSRWFIAVAGVGGSAKLMYDVHAGLKGTHGVAAYYVQMARLALLHQFASFEVSYEDLNGATHECSAVEADAVRINNFGGLMRRWAWGAELQRNDAQLVLFTTGSRSRFLHFTLGRIFGSTRPTKGVDMVYAKRVHCDSKKPGQRLFAEADGEYIGGPPVEIEIVPDMLNLLMSTKQ